MHHSRVTDEGGDSPVEEFLVECEREVEVDDGGVVDCEAAEHAQQLELRRLLVSLATQRVLKLLTTEWNTHHIMQYSRPSAILKTE